MTRLIPHTEKGPLRVLKSDVAGDALFLCRCGLSANGAFCDGSHKRTLDERAGSVYHYARGTDGQLVRIEIATAVPPVPSAAPAAAALPLPIPTSGATL